MHFGIPKCFRFYTRSPYNGFECGRSPFWNPLNSFTFRCEFEWHLFSYIAHYANLYTFSELVTAVEKFKIAKEKEALKIEMS